MYKATQIQCNNNPFNNIYITNYDNHVRMNPCNLPIYILHLGDLLVQQGRLLDPTGSTYPMGTQKIHFTIFFWGLLPRLTTKVLPRLLHDQLH